MATKNEVLSILETSRGRFISGQEFAETLEVSRTAVWKAIRSLKEEGHRILAVQNKGYCLDEGSDRLTEEGVRAALGEECALLSIQVLERTSSTNTQAKKLAADGAAHGSLVIAEEQTEGRGRAGKGFFSPRGAGLYMSLILKPEPGLKEPQKLTIAAASATAEAIESLTGKKPKIKWVNDLYLDGRKICGILTEAVTDFESGGFDSFIVGIGVDCQMEGIEIPPELQGIIGSLGGVNRNRLAAEITKGVLERFPRLGESALMEEYRTRSMMKGREVSFAYQGNQYTGTVTGIGEGGELLVRLPGGESLCLSSGEISLESMAE